MAKKPAIKTKTKKAKRETFKICSFTELGAKALRKSYGKAGYQFVSMRYDDTKGMFEQTFEDKMDP